jgi:hypothetical protein
VQSGFGSGLALTGARWGAAYPNIDRNAAGAAAGTNLWAILEWRLDARLHGVRAAVDLVDAAGHRLATVASFHRRHLRTYHLGGGSCRSRRRDPIEARL